MANWPYVLGGILAVGIPVVASAKPKGGDVAPASERQKRFRCAFAATGLGDDWLRFLEQTAQRESAFNPRALNKTSGEVAASRTTAERNKDTLAKYGFSVSEWSFGSKGLFQFLGPTVALSRGSLRFPASMTNPDMGYDPGIALAAALDYARGLMGWDNFAGTWASLNVGWGNPSKMGDAASLASSAKKLEDRAAKLGWKRGWAKEKVPTIRDQSQSEMKALAATARSFYEGCDVA